MDTTHPIGNEGETAVSAVTPENHSALIVVCPHSGIYTPDRFKSMIAVDLQDILSRGDRYTDWISKLAPDHNAQFIISTVAPAFLNVGRAATSIHPDEVRGDINSLPYDVDDIYVNDGQGQGLVATQTLYGGYPIYKEGMEPDVSEIRQRIHDHYMPFHSAISVAVERNIQKHGMSLLFDVHTCPSTGTVKDPDTGNERTDIIISDRFGQSCDIKYMDILEGIGLKNGFSVKRNDPYTGGHNTRHYGAAGLHADKGAQSLQIEWNRKTLGIDQQSFEIINQDAFDKVAACHDEMIQALGNALG